MPKFGFITDPHIGPSGSRIDPETGLNARLLDHLGTFHRAVDQMIELGLSGVIVGGDLFRNAKPGPTLENLLGMEFMRLVSAGMWVVLIDGNHDQPLAVSEKTALACYEWMHGVTVVHSPQLLAREGLDILAVPYPRWRRLLSDDRFREMSATERQALVRGSLISEMNRLAAREGLTDPGVPLILAAHIALDTASVVEEEDEYMLDKDITISVGDIPATVDCGLFGHIHAPQRIARYSDGRVRDQIQPFDLLYVGGSTDIENHRESMQEKQFLVIDTDERTVTRVLTNPRHFRTFDLDITDKPVEDLVASTFTREAVEGHVVRVRLRLRGDQAGVTPGMYRALYDAGVFEAKIEKEFERTTRARGGTGGAESHEDRIRRYGEMTNMPADKIGALVSNALPVIEEVASAL